MPAIIAIFFLSGATGLVYQVVWAKYLGQFLGNTSHAHAIVLATFLGGLAIGNALLGKWVDRQGDPLRLYGFLELGIGLLAALSPALLAVLAEAYTGLAAGLGLSGPAGLAVKFAFAAVALLPPTILMGGTLPALGRYLTRSMGALTGAISGLYFLNSAGAVAGALAAGFWLIPVWGLDRAVMAAAILNGAIAVAAFALARLRLAEPAVDALDAPEDAIAFSAAQRRLVIAVALLSGFVSLAFEIAWIRLLTLVMGSSTYSFSIMLAAFISGIALGSFLVNRGRVPGKNPLVQFAWAEIGLAASVLATLPLYERLPHMFYLLSGLFARTEATFYVFEGLKFGFAFALMIVPTTFLGATLPLATRVATRSVGEVGEKVGQVFSANTLGNVLGALTASLVLLPLLGVRGLIEAGVVASLALGLALLWSASAPERRPVRVLAAAAAALVAYKALVPGWDMNIMASGPFRSRGAIAGSSFEAYKQAYSHQRLLYYKDDSSASVAVIEQDGELQIDVNGKTDASSRFDLPTQIMVGQLPFFMRPGLEKVFLIGLGSGVTAGSILAQPEVRLTAAEISKGVVEAAGHFGPYNRQVLDDPRLDLHVDDALSYLQARPDTYGAIVCQPSNPWVAGNANLFTQDFYRIIKRRLAPEGVVVQWLQNYEIGDDSFQLILRTYSRAFKHVSLWQVRSTDWVLLGSDAPLDPDWQAAEARFAIPSVSEDLARIEVRHLSTVLAMHAATDAAVRRAAGPGPLNELRLPILEYAAPKGFFMDTIATLPYELDERRRPGAEGLLLPRYLEARGHGLTPAEFRDVVAHHRRGGIQPEVTRPFLAAWQRHYPQDPQPRWLAVEALIKAGQDRLAYEKVQQVLAEAPREPAVVGLAARLEFAMAKAEANALFAPPGAYERILRHVATLEALAPAQAAENRLLLARAHLLAGRVPEALAAFESAAAASAAGADRAAVLSEAAREAYRRGEAGHAARLAAATLAEDPQDADALAIAAAIMAR